MDPNAHDPPPLDSLPPQPARPGPPPLPRPAPVAPLPLGYVRPMDREDGIAVADPSRLPPRLIVIAIISMIWGALSLVTGLVAYPVLEDAYQRSIPPAPPPPPAPIPPANVTPYDGDVVLARGLPFDVREALVKAVTERVALPPDRRIMLERFLADAGRDVFGDDPPADAARAAKLIEEAGQAESGHDGEGPFAPHFVTTRLGTLQLNNSRAVFMPGGGGGGARPTTLDGTLLTGPDGRVRWSARAVKGALEHVRRSRQPQPTTAEQAAVILPIIAASPAKPPRNFRDNFGFYEVDLRSLGLYGPSGSPMLTVKVNGVDTMVLPDGRQAPGSSFPNGWDANCNPLPRPAPSFQPAMPGSLAAIRTMKLESLTHAVMGATMITAGLLTLVRRSGSARLHRWWATAKFVVVAGSLSLLAWYVSSLPPAITSNGTFQASISGTVVGVFASLVYAAVVLAVLNSSLARAYYDYRGETNAMVSRHSRARWRELSVHPAARAALVTAAALAALGAAFHARSAVAVTGDGAAVPHAALLALAVAVLAFCARHLVAAMLRGKSANAGAAFTAAAVLALGLLLPPDAASAQQRRSAKAAREARATAVADAPAAGQPAPFGEVLRELAEWKPKSAKTGEIMERQRRLRDALAQGPEAERLTFELLPKANFVTMEVLGPVLRGHLKERAIAPEAHAAARSAIPVLVEQAKRRGFSEGSDPPWVIRRVAEIPGITPELCLALLRAKCPADRLGDMLEKGDRAAVAKALEAIAVDGKAAFDERRDAVGALARQGEAGMPLVRRLADGTHPAVADSETANDFGRQLREHALRMLTVRRDVAPDPADLDAAVASLASTQHIIRFTARGALAESGRPGLERLIAYYRDTATPQQLRDAGSGVTGQLPFPSALLEERHAATPEHRRAAATIMSLLASYYERGRGLVKVEGAIPELQRMIDGDDAELRRQAAATLLSAWVFQKQIDDATVTRLLTSPHPDVRAAAAKSVLSGSGQRRELSLDLLTPMLASDDAELRRRVASRIFSPQNRGQHLPPEVVYAALDSAHPDVAREAARYLSAGEYFRQRVGLDTWSKLDAKIGWNNYAQLQMPSPEPTPWPPAPLPVAPNPPAAAAAPALPPGPAELPLMPAGWMTLAAAALAAALGLTSVMTARAPAPAGSPTTRWR